MIALKKHICKLLAQRTDVFWAEYAKHTHLCSFMIAYFRLLVNPLKECIQSAMCGEGEVKYAKNRC